MSSRPHRKFATELTDRLFQLTEENLIDKRGFKGWIQFLKMLGEQEIARYATSVPKKMRIQISESLPVINYVRDDRKKIAPRIESILNRNLRGSLEAKTKPESREPAPRSTGTGRLKKVRR